MADPIPPYFVLFAADRIPRDVDHTEANPGGDGRAGHTWVHFDGKGGLSFALDTTDPRPDGTIAVFYRSANVIFRLTDFKVAVSSDYATGSCAYNATQRHEVNAHVRGPIGIMYGFRDKLIMRLNAVPLPTQAKPLRIPQKDVERITSGMEQRVFNVVAAVRREVSQALRADTLLQDSPENDRKVYDQCPRVEWHRR